MNNYLVNQAKSVLLVSGSFSLLVCGGLKLVVNATPVELTQHVLSVDGPSEESCQREKET